MNGQRTLLPLQERAESERFWIVELRATLRFYQEECYRNPDAAKNIKRRLHLVEGNNPGCHFSREQSFRIRAIFSDCA
jgi:hypothetical protein